MGQANSEKIQSSIKYDLEHFPKEIITGQPFQIFLSLNIPTFFVPDELSLIVKCHIKHLKLKQKTIIFKKCLYSKAYNITSFDNFQPGFFRCNYAIIIPYELPSSIIWIDNDEGLSTSIYYTCKAILKSNDKTHSETEKKFNFRVTNKSNYEQRNPILLEEHGQINQMLILNKVNYKMQVYETQGPQYINALLFSTVIDFDRSFEAYELVGVNYRLNQIVKHSNGTYRKEYTARIFEKTIYYSSNEVLEQIRIYQKPIFNIYIELSKIIDFIYSINIDCFHVYYELEVTPRFKNYCKCTSNIPILKKNLYLFDQQNSANINSNQN